MSNIVIVSKKNNICKKKFGGGCDFFYAAFVKTVSLTDIPTGYSIHESLSPRK